MSIAQILENQWFRVDYKPPYFEQDEYVNLDDIDAVFSNSQVIKFRRYEVLLSLKICAHITLFKLLQEHLVTERIEKPVSMNAFELISRSEGFSLENLFNKQMVHYLCCSIFSVTED